MNDNNIFIFTGSSGTGKSTCLKFLKENFDIECQELSARPFLPKGNSYDVSMTDDIQLNIMFNNTTTILKKLYEGGNVVYTRSPIDVLSYARVLGKGLACEKQQIDLIKYLNDKVIYLYIPIEFPMKETSDKLRGMNEKVRYQTDAAIYELIDEMNIPHFTIHGSIEQREETLSEIMNKYNIKKK
ncbi:hypothetical protein SJC03_118 [Bacteroides phage SJC03]|nr:hypothetical protein SJC03_118 [Bacteroides phage SJC03]